MSENHVNRAYRLRQRPQGELADGDLELVEEQLPPLEDGEALVRSSTCRSTRPTVSG